MRILILLSLFFISCVSSETQEEIKTLRGQRDRVMKMLEMERSRPPSEANSLQIDNLMKEFTAAKEALVLAEQKGEMEKAKSWDSAGGITGMIARFAQMFNSVPGVAFGAIALRGLSEAMMAQGKKLQPKPGVPA